jgi:hypothetical protein
MSTELINRLRGQYQVGVNGEFGTRSFADFIPSISLEAADRIETLQYALEDAKGFAVWTETLGRTDCEIYKHELKGDADRSIERINKALGAIK